MISFHIQSRECYWCPYKTHFLVQGKNFMHYDFRSKSDKYEFMNNRNYISISTHFNNFSFIIFISSVFTFSAITCNKLSGSYNNTLQNPSYSRKPLHSEYLLNIVSFPMIRPPIWKHSSVTAGNKFTKIIHHFHLHLCYQFLIFHSEQTHYFQIPMRIELTEI